MSNPRAHANQRLYHANILINAWRDALAQEQVAKKVLEQAFGPAICAHLSGAYGWFLLEVAQPERMPQSPPGCCADLPAVEPGRQTAPEILEFQRLEQQPWLAHILNPALMDTTAAANKPGKPNLAMESGHVFEPDEALLWHARLNGLFDRMSDSLDEY